MKLKRFLKIFLRKDLYTKSQFECLSETHGNPGAAFTICPDKINENSVVYSFGIGTDISFDVSIIKKYKLNVYAFDPTPVTDADFSPRIADTDRHFFTIGAGFAVSDAMDIDVAYGYIKAKDRNQTASSATSKRNGLYQAKINILAASMAYRF